MENNCILHPQNAILTDSKKIEKIENIIKKQKHFYYIEKYSNTYLL